MHIHTYTYTHTYIGIHRHTPIHTLFAAWGPASRLLYTCTYKHILTPIPTYTYTHTPIHPYTHTHLVGGVGPSIKVVVHMYI